MMVKKNERLKKQLEKAEAIAPVVPAMVIPEVNPNQPPLEVITHVFRKNQPVEKIIAEAPSVVTAFNTNVPRETSAVDASSAAKKVTEDRDQILIETDLTRKKLFATISDGLGAMTAIVNDDGVQVGEVPNHTVRVKYANLAAEILGEKISGNDSKNVNMINIYLPEQLKKAREKYQNVGRYGIADMRTDDGGE